MSHEITRPYFAYYNSVYHIISTTTTGKRGSSFDDLGRDVDDRADTYQQ
jgi:hypothetical protein